MVNAYFLRKMFVGICLLCAFASSLFGSEEVSYTVDAWSDSLGHHRARVSVAEQADVVRVYLPWRLHNQQPEKKCIIVINANTSEKVTNVLPIYLDNERAEILFEPVGSGMYFVYYMPFEPRRDWGVFTNDYLPMQNTADPNWVKAHHLQQCNPEQLEQFPLADLIDFQSRTQFDSFYPMEVVAAAEEKEQLLQKYPDPYLLFVEDREHPIRMKDEIPLRWIKGGPSATFDVTIDRNEYFAFQIGLFASKQAIDNVEIKYSDLVSKDGDILPASNFNCFNLGGIDPYGNSFRKQINVPRGSVQPLWIGVDVPASVVPGDYTGVIAIQPENAPSKDIEISFTINRNMLKDRGDSEPWRHSRLRWLDSTAGIDESVVDPYTPLVVSGNQVSCLGRKVRFARNGLPESIQSWGTEILDAPVHFVVEVNSVPIIFKRQEAEIVRQSSGIVTWKSESHSEVLDLECGASMEFDGYMLYKIKLRPCKNLTVSDIRLELPVREEASTYMMGIGRKGCATPEEHTWRWTGPCDSFWMGAADAGFHCELRGASYNGPLLRVYKPLPPVSWGNDGKGGCTIKRNEDVTMASVFSGPRVLQAGDELTFEFALLITPVKPLDTAKHFRERYYHNGSWPEPNEAEVASGINILNLHHGNVFNPHINYPFVAIEPLKGFVDKWHERGMKVKLYYTVRELSNYVTELWALRSLGQEILADGPGGGFPWLREHLVSGYAPAWYHPFVEEGTADASIENTGESRWYNYYIEGLGWLVKNVGIDGLYLDEVSYDRRIMKRIRRVLDQNRSGCLIDFHGNELYSTSPAIQSTELFPYIDRLWFGEGFKYNEMSPEQWLIEVSGIPFGLMGDMLQDGGNPWRGMLYGMTNRLPFIEDADPRPIWEVMDSFGIADAKMIGYWDSACPVAADHNDVLATAYVKKDEMLVAIASWACGSVDCKLIIDWVAIGFDSADAELYAPSIRDFQQERTFDPTGTIPIEPQRGWLIVVKK